MVEINGWWIPEHDKDVIKHLSFHDEYHPLARNALINYTKNFRTLVDIGAHIGLFSKPLLKKFQKIICFEPNKDNFECLQKNLTNQVELYNLALGDRIDKIQMVATRIDSMSWLVLANSRGQTEMRTLDSFNLENIDCLKCDCEGFELFVLQGAKQTLLRCKPTVLVEQKLANINYGIEKYGAGQFLENLGMKRLHQENIDFVYGW